MLWIALKVAGIYLITEGVIWIPEAIVERKLVSKLDAAVPLLAGLGVLLIRVPSLDAAPLPEWRVREDQGSPRFRERSARGRVGPSSSWCALIVGAPWRSRRCASARRSFLISRPLLGSYLRRQGSTTSLCRHPSSGAMASSVSSGARRHERPSVEWPPCKPLEPANAAAALTAQGQRRWTAWPGAGSR
jgi:hypothetical protein